LGGAQGGLQDRHPKRFRQYRCVTHIENFFCNLTQWRGIATPYDKTAWSFVADQPYRGRHGAAMNVNGPNVKLGAGGQEADCNLPRSRVNWPRRT
jgi:hypothetical protein